MGFRSALILSLLLGACGSWADDVAILDGSTHPDLSVPLSDGDGFSPADAAAPRDLTSPIDLGPAGWPLQGHDAQRRSCAAVAGPAKGATRWTSSLGVLSTPMSGPDGALWVADKTATIVALAPGDGTSSVTGPSGCAVFGKGGDGSVYYDPCSGPARLCAFNPVQRKDRWCAGLVFKPLDALLAGDGTLYVTTVVEIDALAPGDGHQIWSAALPNTVVGTAVGIDGSVIVATQENLVFALDPATGKERWRVKRSGVFQPFSPLNLTIGRDGNIYLRESGSYDWIAALDGKSGAERWQYSTAFAQAVAAPVVAPDGTLRFALEMGDGRTLLTALSPDGKLWWSIFFADDKPGPPIVDAAGTTFLVTGHGHVFAVDAGGVQRWDFQAGAVTTVSPAIGADGLLYVGLADGTLRAIGP